MKKNKMKTTILKNKNKIKTVKLMIFLNKNGYIDEEKQNENDYIEEQKRNKNGCCWRQHFRRFKWVCPFTEQTDGD